MIFDKLTPQAAEEVQALHRFLCEAHIYVLFGNSGRSARVLNFHRPVGAHYMSLEAAVSLYNKGKDSYAYPSLAKCQKQGLPVDWPREPLTLQRSKGGLVTQG